MDELIALAISMMAIAIGALGVALGLGTLHAPGSFLARYAGSCFVLGGACIASFARDRQ